MSLAVRFLFLIPISFNILYGITLDELISSGLKNSATIRKSNMHIKMMNAKRDEAKAKKFGEVDVVGSYTHYNLPRTLAPIVPSSLSPNSPIETTKDLFSTGIQYTVPLFMGGALREQVKIEELSKDISQEKIRLNREELIYNIRSLYLSGLSLQDLMDSQSNYIDELERLKETITKSVEFGKKARIDILKSDNELEEARGRLAQMENSLKMIKSTLKAITHIDEIERLEPTPVNMGSVPEIESEEFDNLIRFRLQNLQIKKSGRVVNRVKSLKKPQVSLNGYFGYNYDIDDPINKENLWQLGVTVKWNIFDFGLMDAKIEEAKVSRLQAILDKEIVEEGFKKLVAQAIKQIEDALVEHRINESKLTLLKETEKIEKARYDVGVSTLNDLLLSKAKTALTKSKLIESQYKYQGAIYYLDYLFERGEKR